VQNGSTENKLCIFTHIFDKCNIARGVLSSAFPLIQLVLCAIYYLLLVNIVFHRSICFCWFKLEVDSCPVL